MITEKHSFTVVKVFSSVFAYCLKLWTPDCFAFYLRSSVFCLNIRFVSLVSSDHIPLIFIVVRLRHVMLRDVFCRLTGPTRERNNILNKYGAADDNMTVDRMRVEFAVLRKCPMCGMDVFALLAVCSTSYKFFVTTKYLLRVTAFANVLPFMIVSIVSSDLL